MQIGLIKNSHLCGRLFLVVKPTYLLIPIAIIHYIKFKYNKMELYIIIIYILIPFPPAWIEDEEEKYQEGSVVFLSSQRRQMYLSRQTYQICIKNYSSVTSIAFAPTTPTLEFAPASSSPPSPPLATYRIWSIIYPYHLEGKVPPPPPSTSEYSPM